MVQYTSVFLSAPPKILPTSFKNRPLRHEKIRWKSDMPLTEGQLKSKRDEFWDTAPAFEGKAEIWAALKAATEATEMQPEPDYQLAQVGRRDWHAMALALRGRASFPN